MNNFRLILRLILATTIVLGLIPAQAIKLPCAPQQAKQTCHTKKESCCAEKKSCGCEITSKQSPQNDIALTTPPQYQWIAVLSEPTHHSFSTDKPSEQRTPEQKANAPPGTPPRESASRAPPVNL